MLILIFLFTGLFIYIYFCDPNCYMHVSETQPLVLCFLLLLLYSFVLTGIPPRSLSLLPPHATMISLKLLTPQNFFSKDPHCPQFHSRPPSKFSSYFLSPPKSTKLLHVSPLKYQFGTENISQNAKDPVIEKEQEKQKRIHDDEKGINGIHVPRQKYISVSKSELLEAILTLFQSKEDADEFVDFSK